MSFTLVAGQSQQCTAQPQDQLGNPLYGVGAPVWTSADPSIATVTGNGVVTAVTGGTTTITASLGGVSGNTTVTVPPVTPAQMAAGVAAVSDFRFRALYVPGINQIIAVNGGSPTGFYCSRWDDALIPGQGKHLRTNVSFPNGVACLATGEACGGGELEIPAGLGMLGGRSDPTILANQPSLTGSFGVKEFFADRGAGFTIGLVSKQGNSVSQYVLGEDADPDVIQSFGNGGSTTNLAFMDDDLANGGFQGLSSILHNATWFCNFDDAASGVAGWSQRLLVGRNGRDLPNVFWGPSSSTYDWSIAGMVGKRFRLQHKPAATIDPSVNSAISCLYIGSGRMNAAATKIFCDWAARQSWGASIKDDTRRLGVQFGDSFIAPIDSRALVQGSNGAPAISQFTLVGPQNSGAWAQPGHNVVTWQYPFINFWRDCDFSKRPAPVGSIAIGASEYENNSTVGATNAAQQNAWWIDQLKALDSRVRCFGFNDQRPINNAPTSDGGNEWLDAHLVQDGHAVLLVDLWRTLGNDPYMWGDGTNANGTGQIRGPVWDNSHHPSSSGSTPVGTGQEYWLAMYRLGFRKCLGDDISAVTFKVDPDADHITLNDAGPTHQIAPTAKSATGATLGGKTYTYSLGGNSSSTYISVSGTGLVTKVATNPNSQTPPWVKVVANDGGVGLATFDCIASSILTDTFTRTNGSSPGTADTGQAWSADSGTWSTNGTQLVADATSNARAHVDPGSAVHTVQLDVVHASNQQYVQFRWSDAANYWIAGFQASSNNLQLWKVVAGSFTELGTIGGVNVGAHTGTILVDLTSNVNVKFNGSSVQTSSDAFNSSSRIVGAFGQSGVFDNMSVT